MIDFLERLAPTWQDAGVAVAASIIMFCGIVVIVRVIGLRSFSKMSSFDFATTVAVGSVMAAVAVTSQPVIIGIIASATLLGFQALVSRYKTAMPLRFVENKPVLLMWEGEYVEEQLERTRVSKDDVRAKLRESNAGELTQVRAVVLETTGDVSVIHGDQGVDDEILEDVEVPDWIRR